MGAMMVSRTRRGPLGPTIGRASLLGLALIAAVAAPSHAQEALGADQVAVTFKESLGGRFIAMFNSVMGTQTVKHRGEFDYTFRVGPGGNQNDFALFFAHLPYVKSVSPAARLSGAERDAPPVVVRIDTPHAAAAPGFVAGQLLVKFKPGVQRAAIDLFNRTTGAIVKEQIEGIDVWLLQLPPTLAVDQARVLYTSSDIVAYAEPNRVMTIAPAGETAIPPDNAGNGVYLSPGRLLGDNLLVRYRAEGPTMDLINQIYGTKTLEEAGSNQYRVSLPAGVNALVAQHMFRICPYVLQVEPSYGR
jgi:hypothetical protein